MSTLTRERIEQLANGNNICKVTREERIELARIALASLEAEPVAYMYKDNLHADARFSLHTRFGNWSQEDINEYEITEIPLYTAPPAPVSVPDENGLLPCPFCGSPAEHYPDGDMEGYSVMCGHKNGDCNSWIFGFATPEEAERSWNTRAAMFQCAENAGSPTTMKTAPTLDSSPKNAESPSGNSPVIPDWQARAEKMAELHGMSFVVFRNGDEPQCADPSKVVISFTDEGLGYGTGAPQQEVKP